MNPERDRSDLERLQSVWQSLAEDDPMWAILSWPNKKGRKWDLDEFLATGEDEVCQLMMTLATHDLRFAAGTALDFGCGIGRLSQALVPYFDTVYGVDISPTMVQQADELNRHGGKCRYLVNSVQDLRVFPDDMFSFIYSNIVPQHVPPWLTELYLREFLRVLQPGGLLVFQLPSRFKVEHGLPLEAWSATITVAQAELSAAAGYRCLLPVTVKNSSPVTWEHDPWSVIALANHWLDEHGTMVRMDDGRMPLMSRIEPNQSRQFELEITVPPRTGRYLLELDLVQEGVSWFAAKGSMTTRLPVQVIEPSSRVAVSTPSEATIGLSKHNSKGDNQVFEGFSTYCIPRSEVLQTLRHSGGHLAFIQLSDCAGPGFLSYLYFVRKVTPSRV